MDALYSDQNSSHANIAAAVTIGNDIWIHTGCSCCY